MHAILSLESVVGPGGFGGAHCPQRCPPSQLFRTAYAPGRQKTTRRSLCVRGGPTSMHAWHHAWVRSRHPAASYVIPMHGYERCTCMRHMLCVYNGTSTINKSRSKSIHTLPAKKRNAIPKYL